jgi:ferredoxin
MSEAPEVFRVDDEGVVTVLLETPPEELRAVVADALRYCPTGAIALED